MRRRLRNMNTTLTKSACAFLFIVLAPACGVTPVPQPPLERTLHPENITIVQIAIEDVAVVGQEGAIVPGDVDVRITFEPTNVVLFPLPFGTTHVDERGAFSQNLPTERDSKFHFEALESDRDVFLGTITGGPGDTAVSTDPGPDRDDDGSPDAIDCAPDDPSVGGQRC